MMRPVVHISALAACVVLFSGFSAAQEATAYVLEVRGTWVVNGSGTVSRGRLLRAGSTIRRQSASSGDRITVSETGGKIIGSASRDCSDDCSAPIVVPPVTTAQTWSEFASDKAAKAYSYFKTFLPTAPRDMPAEARSGDLTEVVVKLEGGKADLTPVMKAQGEQFLRWRTVAVQAAPGAWTKPVKVDKTLKVSGLKPGLYELNLVRSNGSSYEPVASAWVLVAAADYDKKRAAFQEIQKLAAEWGDKVEPATVEILYRASLEDIGRKPSK